MRLVIEQCPGTVWRYLLAMSIAIQVDTCTAGAACSHLTPVSSTTAGHERMHMVTLKFMSECYNSLLPIIGK